MLIANDLQLIEAGEHQTQQKQDNQRGKNNSTAYYAFFAVVVFKLNSSCHYIWKNAGIFGNRQMAI